ncbi:hypothetical protein INH39_00170 [Massilia violaceinigra]|uniref:Uncharacterized protein n=1 Tax=Massilia violaceinigra TaxID=2045208 RepID=A0ABY4A889_9BURK|nr:YwqG family protein [Massilia violaceinigra]UOD30219.1 hypothetical protein INH39_00170 [Massilia violaceinigra]
MNIDALATRIAASADLAPLTAHLDYLRDIAQPCIEISLLESVAPAPAASRFGGVPMVPAGFAWPVHAVGQYRFLGQNLAPSFPRRRESIAPTISEGAIDSRLRGKDGS